MTVAQPVDYLTRPLELFTVTDLTDAIGVKRAAELLNTSKRAIYTVRNTNVLSQERVLALINEVKTDETGFRRKLVIKRNMQLTRAQNREERATA